MAIHAPITSGISLKGFLSPIPEAPISLSKRLFMTAALLSSGHVGGRAEIEDLIEDLVSALDDIDPDPGLEPDVDDELCGDEEPSLGWTNVQARDNQYGSGDHHHYWLGYDREQDEADDEDGGDLEPNLGAPERHPASWEWAPLGVVCREPGHVRHVREKSQETWADGLAGDHEREEENEHGGDILDEPHDGCGEDDEHDHRDC